VATAISIISTNDPTYFRTTPQTNFYGTVTNEAEADQFHHDASMTRAVHCPAGSLKLGSAEIFRAARSWRSDRLKGQAVLNLQPPNPSLRLCQSYDPFSAIDGGEAESMGELLQRYGRTFCALTPDELPPATEIDALA
jgi:hypothetical protein